MTIKQGFGLMTAMVVLAISVSCNKEASLTPLEDMPYEQRLEGIWELQNVQYATQFPNPQNPLQTINISGEGEQVEGLFVLGHDPNEMDYRYEFVANISLADSVPAIPIPIERSGKGTWSSTSDESRIFVTEDNQTSYTFVVVENGINRQVYHTTFEETLMGIFTIEVDVALTFVR